MVLRRRNETGLSAHPAVLEARFHYLALGARVVGMSLPVGIMGPEGGTATVDDGKASGMTDHNGVLMMQRALLAGTLGLAMAQKAAAILEGEPSQAAPSGPVPHDESRAQAGADTVGGADTAAGAGSQGPQPGGGFRDPQGSDGAVLRAILDAANECLGHFDDRPPGERWCDTLFHLLDLAAFAAELD